MVYGELGRYLLEIRVKLRMVSSWTKLVKSENKLSSNLYRLMLQIHQSGNHDFKWISCVMSMFDNTGLSYIFPINSQALVARTTPLFLTSVYKFIFNKISLFLYYFISFFLILTCSCQYSYNLMLTSNCMCHTCNLMLT